MTRALGVRLHKPSEGWPTAEWAVIGDDPRTVVAHGQASPPRNYSEVSALRHLHEALAAAVAENGVTRTFIWEIEGNARMNQAMRPRIRAEGVASVAVTLSGSKVTLGAWRELSALANATGTKSSYTAASTVCGVVVGSADSQAVLAAIAALAIRD